MSEKRKENIMTKRQLLTTLKPLPKESQASVTCALIGHSRIQTMCFGYYNCARCGDQLGDTLASIYNGAEKAVVVGHKCKVCERNYKECTWKDKFMCPDPFGR